MLLTRSPLSGSRSRLRARLACVKHAASVHSEPGSNSPVGKPDICRARIRLKTVRACYLSESRRLEQTGPKPHPRAALVADFTLPLFSFQRTGIRFSRTPRLQPPARHPYSLEVAREGQLPVRGRRRTLLERRASVNPLAGVTSTGSGQSDRVRRLGVSLKRIMVKPIDRLVQVSSTPRSAYTSCLSTWSSSRGLQGDLISGGASRLDAFSGYPFRT